MLLGLIVACEVGFWLLLLGGLLVRYALRRPRLGAALLVLTPVIDVVLLVAATVDLHRGAEATTAHGLAAVYLGVSVAFGPGMVRWADQRVAHRFAGGPEPERAPRSGPEHARHERRQWGRHALAWTIGTGLMLLAWVSVDDRDRAEALLRLAQLWTVVLVVDGLISWSYTVSPRSPRGTTDARR